MILALLLAIVPRRRIDPEAIGGCHGVAAFITVAAAPVGSHRLRGDHAHDLAVLLEILVPTGRRIVTHLLALVEQLHPPRVVHIQLVGRRSPQIADIQPGLGDGEGGEGKRVGLALVLQYYDIWLEVGIVVQSWAGPAFVPGLVRGVTRGGRVVLGGETVAVLPDWLGGTIVIPTQVAVIVGCDLRWTGAVVEGGEGRVAARGGPPGHESAEKKDQGSKEGDESGGIDLGIFGDCFFQERRLLLGLLVGQAALDQIKGGGDVGAHGRGKAGI